MDMKVERSPKDYPHSDLTDRVIGAALEVHRELGPGFLEKVYETALSRELESAGVEHETQAAIPVKYKGQALGVYYADLLIGSNVLCEIKAVDSLKQEQEAQVIHYLKATGVPVGLLLNFGGKSLQVKRRVLTQTK